MCIGHGRYLVMHGGRNNFVLDTAHVLDLMTRTWIEVSACERVCVCAAHTVCLQEEDCWPCLGSRRREVPLDCDIVQRSFQDAL